MFCAALLGNLWRNSARCARGPADGPGPRCHGKCPIGIEIQGLCQLLCQTLAMIFFKRSHVGRCGARPRQKR